MPLGSRARLEHDILCLAEAYNWSPDQVMALPCSRRHRLIKMREMIVDAQNGRTTDFGAVSDQMDEFRGQKKPKPKPKKPPQTGLGNQLDGLSG